MLVLALAGLAELQAAPGAAKAKPGAAASAAQAGDQGDLCLQDGLCRAHYTRARGLSKASDYEGALTAYEAAYHRRAVPWLLLNIGRTLHKLGKPAEALGYYRRYQQEDAAPVPERLKLLKEYTDQAEADLALQKAPPAATVAEASPGPSVPAAGAAGEPPPGPAVPPATSAGAEPETGPTAETPAAKEKRSPLAAPLLSGEGGTAPAGPGAVDRPRMSRTGLWVGLGVTGGFLLAGAALAITAQVSSAQLRDTTYVGAMPGPDVLALQDRTRATAISADVLFGVSAVSLGVTLLATLLPKPAPRAQPSERARPAGPLGGVVAPDPRLAADGAPTGRAPAAPVKSAEDAPAAPVGGPTAPASAGGAAVRPAPPATSPAPAAASPAPAAFGP